jgi:dihydrofolate reductase
MNRLIVAIDAKRGIAKAGIQPWSIPDDLLYFRNQTKKYGGNVLVGGTTFRNDMKCKPLGERKTIVASKSQPPTNGVQVVQDAIAWLTANRNKDIWIMGGASMYKQVIEAGLADELYITHILADFGCDTFFPKYESKFKKISESEMHIQNGLQYRFARYVPK